MALTQRQPSIRAVLSSTRGLFIKMYFRGLLFSFLARYDGDDCHAFLYQFCQRTRVGRPRHGGTYVKRLLGKRGTPYLFLEICKSCESCQRLKWCEKSHPTFWWGKTLPLTIYDCLLTIFGRVNQCKSVSEIEQKLIAFLCPLSYTICYEITEAKCRTDDPKPSG